MSSSVALHLLYPGRVFHLNTELADELAKSTCSGILSLPPEAGVTGKPPYPSGVSTGAEDLNSRPYTLHSDHLSHLYFAHL